MISRLESRSSGGMSLMTETLFDDHFLNLKPASLTSSESCCRNFCASLTVSQESKTSSTYIELLTVSAALEYLTECSCACVCRINWAQKGDAVFPNKSRLNSKTSGSLALSKFRHKKLW